MWKTRETGISGSDAAPRQHAVCDGKLILLDEEGNLALATPSEKRP